MKAAWIVAVVALLGGGAWLVWSDPSPAGGNGKSGARAAKSSAGDESDDAQPLFDDAPGSAGSSAMDARVAQLEREVSALKRQVGMMKGVSSAFARGDGSDEYDAEATATPQFGEAVRAVIDEEREREREDENERRRERWESRSSERLDDLVSQAGIDHTQRESISALWSAERDKAMELFAAARSGDKDFDEAREEMEALRKHTDAEAAKLLSGEQYTAYEELRPRGPGGRGGRRGGGGGGG